MDPPCYMNQMHFSHSCLLEVMLSNTQSLPMELCGVGAWHRWAEAPKPSASFSYGKPVCTFFCLPLHLPLLFALLSFILDFILAIMRVKALELLECLENRCPSQKKICSQAPVCRAIVGEAQNNLSDLSSSTKKFGRFFCWWEAPCRMVIHKSRWRLDTFLEQESTHFC